MVKLHFTPVVGKGDDPTLLEWLAVADPGKTRHGNSGRGAGYPMQLRYGHLPFHEQGMFMALGDNQGISVQILGNHKPGGVVGLLKSPHPQPFSLAQCVIHQPLVLADKPTTGGFDRTRLGGQESAEEFLKPTFPDKADAGAVFFVVYLESRLSGEFSDLLLGCRA